MRRSVLFLLMIALFAVRVSDLPSGAVIESAIAPGGEGEGATENDGPTDDTGEVTLLASSGRAVHHRPPRHSARLAVRALPTPRTIRMRVPGGSSSATPPLRC